jgi:hypothetical protein
MSTAQKHALPRFMAAVDVFEKQGIGSEAEWPPLSGKPDRRLISMADSRRADNRW